MQSVARLTYFELALSINAVAFSCQQITKQTSRGTSEGSSLQSPDSSPKCPFVLGQRAKYFATISSQVCQICVETDWIAVNVGFWRNLGTYVCSKCENELFGSDSKYGHHTPWPAFSRTKHENSLSKKLESKGAFKVRLFYVRGFEFWWFCYVLVVLWLVQVLILQDIMHALNVNILCFRRMPSINTKHLGLPFRLLFALILWAKSLKRNIRKAPHV